MNWIGISQNVVGDGDLLALLGDVNAFALVNTSPSRIGNGAVVHDDVWGMIDQDSVNAWISESNIFDDDVWTVLDVDPIAVETDWPRDIDVAEILYDKVRREIKFEPRPKPEENVGSQYISELLLGRNHDLWIDSQLHVAAKALKIKKACLAAAGQKRQHNEISK